MAPLSMIRNTKSLSNLVLLCLNLLLLILSSASFAPVLLTRTPPSPFGWTLITISVLSLLSSILGIFSQLTQHLLFLLQITLILCSSIAQILAFIVFFSWKTQSLELLSLTKMQKEISFLFDMERIVMVIMFVVQMMILIGILAVQKWWENKYNEWKSERKDMEKKRSRRAAQIHEETMVHVEKMQDIQSEGLSDKKKHVEWTNTDIEDQV